MFLNMANGQNNPKRQPPQDISPDLLQHWIETQKIKALNETKEIQLREKELEFSAKNAEKAMDLQAKHLASLPSEGRKTMTRMALIVGFIILIFLTAVTIWLVMGKEQFANDFLKGISYVVTSILSYLIGKAQRGKKNKQQVDDTEDAHVIDS